MNFRTTKSGALLSGIETRKNIVKYLSETYGISKAALNALIQEAKHNGFKWCDMEKNGDTITIYVVERQMFLGIAKNK